eukprot:GHUV01004874.1.p1 GENE.GHUV01004874.1~~GHUV01004874.1.p1  ORF type:complete len:387 (+),score=80.11 GHUV01004874.1:241-1401(+)
MTVQTATREEALALIKRSASSTGTRDDLHTPGSLRLPISNSTPMSGSAGVQQSGDSTGKAALTSSNIKHLLPAILYGLLNLSSVVTIVVANKVVMSTYEFSFAVCLTWFHSIVTAVGMYAMAAAGMFTVKKVPWTKSAPVACAYVGFVVFNNLSIQFNTVGFYQISKILITPVVVVIEYFAYGKTVSRQKLMAIALLMFGITVATASDTQVSSNPMGLLVATAAVLASALYQVWTGSKQKELGLNGNQLLHQVAPTAVALLAILIPILEPVGFNDPKPGTILGFEYSNSALAWILFSSCLGLVVTLTTYLFIGVTSALTYNVVGHLKTVFIVTSGVVFFGDVVSTKKLIGLVCAMAGIVWYTSQGVTAAPPPPVSSNSNGKVQQQA